MTDAAGSTALPAARETLDGRLARTIGWFVVGFVIWMSRLLLPVPPAPPELDPSWQQGLSYALAHGFQFGREILFTFGPLGGVANGRYQPELFWFQIIVFELLFKGLLVWRWVTALQRWPAGLDRAAIVLAVCVPELGSDAFYFGTLVLIVSFQFDDPPPGRKRLALDLLLIAVIAFIKFTYFLLAAGVVGVVVVRYALRARREGLITLGLYAGMIVLVWCAMRQAPWNLPIYLVRSFSVASGYSEAQAYDGPLEEVRLGLLWILLLLAIAAGTALGSSARRERLLASVAVLGGAYVAFKASFTYHSAHGITFFGFGTIALCSLRPPLDATTLRRILLGVGRAVSYLLCIAGLSMQYQSSQELVGLMFGEGAMGLLRQGNALHEIATLRDRREQNAIELADHYGLPRIRTLVGSATIDQVCSSQGWIFLNRMNWKPRPLFQSYVTVTPSLIQLNEDFFYGPEAPEYVLLELGTIDRRLSGSEDSGAQQALLHGYAPATTEKGLLLLRKDPEMFARPRTPPEVLEEREIEPNEVVRLDSYPGKGLRVRFDVRFSLLGTLRKFAYHAPVTWIRLQLSDNTALRCRLIPSMCRNGVLLRPYIEGNPDWVQVFTRGHDKSVKAFAVFSLDDWGTLYKPKIRITIERCDDLIPIPQPRLERQIAFGSFLTQPLLSASKTEVRSYMIEDREVVLVGPRTDIAFQLEPGSHRLSGKLGMLDVCIGRSDGLDFVVDRVSKDGERTPLFTHTLIPADATQLLVPVDVAFESGPGDRLVLSTTNPPGRNGECDIGYWEAVQIE